MYQRMTLAKDIVVSEWQLFSTIVPTTFDLLVETPKDPFIVFGFVGCEKSRNAGFTTLVRDQTQRAVIAQGSTYTFQVPSVGRVCNMVNMVGQ